MLCTKEVIQQVHYAQYSRQGPYPISDTDMLPICIGYIHEVYKTKTNSNIGYLGQYVFSPCAQNGPTQNSYALDTSTTPPHYHQEANHAIADLPSNLSHHLFKFIFCKLGMIGSHLYSS